MYFFGNNTIYLYSKSLRRIKMFKLGLITDQVSMDFEAALKVIKELGLRYIEIHALWNKNIEELDEREISEAKRLIDKYELEVSIISSTLFLFSVLFFIPLSEAM